MFQRLDGYSSYTCREEYFTFETIDELNRLIECKYEGKAITEENLHDVHCGNRTMVFDGIAETGRGFAGKGVWLLEKHCTQPSRDCYILKSTLQRL